MILSLKVGNPDERLEASLVSHNNSVEKVQMPLVSNNWHTSGELLRKCKGAALRDTSYILLVDFLVLYSIGRMSS